VIELFQIPLKWAIDHLYRCHRAWDTSVWPLPVFAFRLSLMTQILNTTRHNKIKLQFSFFFLSGTKNNISNPIFAIFFRFWPRRWSTIFLTKSKMVRFFFIHRRWWGCWFDMFIMLEALLRTSPKRGWSQQCLQHDGRVVAVECVCEVQLDDIHNIVLRLVLRFWWNFESTTFSKNFA